MKREDVTKQGFCKLPLLWRKLCFNFNLIVTQVGGRLFEMGACE